MARSRRQMDERELAAIIDEQVSDAVLYERDDLGESRRKAQKYFDGDVTLAGDVPPPVNRSSVVSRDVSDVHGWVMPPLVRMFAGADRVVIYEPRRREAEGGAKQATDFINYIFLSECNGYQVLYSALWDGLTYGNGIIKHWWDDTPAYSVESYSGKPEAEYLDLVSDDNVEVLEHTERPDPDSGDAASALSPGGDAAMPAGASMRPKSPGGDVPLGVPDGAMPEMPAMGPSRPGPDMASAGALMGMAMPAPKLHDLKIKRKLYSGCLKIVAVPQEEFRIDRNAIKLDEEHVRFCAHVDPGRTRSSLRQDFPDKADMIDDLPASTSGDFDAAVRDWRWRSVDVPPDHSTDLIEVWECYVQVDWNGDGAAEWRRVITAAGASERQILANEEWGEDLPFTDIVPDPMPHRWRGGNLYEDVCDIQRIKTVFLRGINDNLYWINNPQRYAPHGGIHTSSMDEYMSPTFGGHIWTVGGAEVKELPITFIADKLAFGIEQADKIREFRTGVSPATLGLDQDALQNQKTATEVNQAASASYAKQELRARNIAENLRRMFKCCLKLIIKHEDRERTIRLRGKWIDVNPRGWDADMDVIINTGLGSGSRDRDLTMLQAVAAKQELITQGVGPVIAAKLGVGPDVLFETYRKMVEAAGMKSPETYFPEITRQEVDQLIEQMGSMQQQDPKAAETAAHVKLIEAQTQKVQAELQLRAQSESAKTQMDGAKTQMEMQRGIYDLEHVKAQIENLRAAALANMTKAGATQTDAEINQQLAQLDMIGQAISWHHEQQKIDHDAIDRLVGLHHEKQKIDQGHQIALMRERTKSPGVN